MQRGDDFHGDQLDQNHAVSMLYEHRLYALMQLESDHHAEDAYATDLPVTVSVQD